MSNRIAKRAPIVRLPPKSNAELLLGRSAQVATVIIGLVGCLEGLKVEGSAESLGTHVTSAVVKAIFLVIILDAVFAMFLSGIGV